MKPYLLSLLSFDQTPNHLSAIGRAAKVRGPAFLRPSLWLAIGSVFLASFHTPLQAGPVDQVRLDWAYYNPVSLMLKEKGWLEKDLQWLRFGQPGGPCIGSHFWNCPDRLSTVQSDYSGNSQRTFLRLGPVVHSLVRDL